MLPDGGHAHLRHEEQLIAAGKQRHEAPMTGSDVRVRQVCDRVNLCRRGGPRTVNGVHKGRANIHD
jgi:hypothetical protein